MDQEKIGKFIATQRKNNNLTQKDLAETLGVSINAVSKLERGICLMDMSLLKPLSKALNVSIVDIINGEITNEENNIQATDDAIEKTIKYSKKKLSKNKKISIIITILIIVAAYIITKFIFLRLYNIEDVSNKNTENYIDMIDAIKNPKELLINHKNNNEDYLEYNDIKIRNDFNNYELIEDESSLKYIKKDVEGNLINSVWIGKEYTYIDYLKSSYLININGGLTSDSSKIGVNKVLRKNSITNDIELLEFLSNNYYFKNTIFTPIRDMKTNHDLNEFVAIMSHTTKEYYLLKGSYNGYAFKINDNITEVNILNNNKRYVITFVKCDESYIKDLLSTIEFK